MSTKATAGIIINGTAHTSHIIYDGYPAASGHDIAVMILALGPEAAGIRLATARHGWMHAGSPNTRPLGGWDPRTATTDQDWEALCDRDGGSEWLYLVDTEAQELLIFGAGRLHDGASTTRRIPLADLETGEDYWRQVQNAMELGRFDG